MQFQIIGRQFAKNAWSVQLTYGKVVDGGNAFDANND